MWQHLLFWTFLLKYAFKLNTYSFRKKIQVNFRNNFIFTLKPVLWSTFPRNFYQYCSIYHIAKSTFECHPHKNMLPDLITTATQPLWPHHRRRGANHRFFKCRNKWSGTGRKIGTVGRVLKFFPVKSCDEILRFRSCMWRGIAVKQNDPLAQPYHSITHNVFTIHFTDLANNVGRFNAFNAKKTNHSAYLFHIRRGSRSANK